MVRDLKVENVGRRKCLARVGILSLYATLRVDKIQWCATLKLKNWQKFSLRNWQNLIGNGTLKVELCQRMVGEHLIKQGHKIWRENGVKMALMIRSWQNGRTKMFCKGRQTFDCARP